MAGTRLLTYNDGNINGVQIGDVFTITIRLQKVGNSYSIASQNIVVTRPSAGNNEILTIGDSHLQIKKNLQNNDQTDDEVYELDFDSEEDKGVNPNAKVGGDAKYESFVNHNEIYQLPKPSNRKIKKYVNKTISRRKRMNSRTQSNGR